MFLIDTSSWIESLRVRGDAAVRNRVRDHVLNGTAAWCEMIRLELWNGALGEQERRDLRQLESVVYNAEIDQETWAKSFDLASLARGKGLNASAADLLIVATASRHKMDIDYADKHIELLLKLL